MALINGMMQSWQDTFTVRRVFGEPVEKDGVVVIPVAMVSGGGGGVEWLPAIDVTKLGMAGIALSALIAFVLGRALRRRR